MKTGVFLLLAVIATGPLAAADFTLAPQNLRVA
jgi:hypothetical protein